MAKAQKTRIVGYERVGPPVPGDGPVLSVREFFGRVLVLRSDGERNIVWTLDAAGNWIELGAAFDQSVEQAVNA